MGLSAFLAGGRDGRRSCRPFVAPLSPLCRGFVGALSGLCQVADVFKTQRGA